MGRYAEIEVSLRENPRRWLVTGAAGFIGSHLCERLLMLDQVVVGVDNFATGNRDNLADVAARVGNVRASRFQFLEGDLRDPLVCRWAAEGAELVLHEAALGSVPRSMQDPWSTHSSNVDAFFNLILAAGAARVERFVYASSSSVYGDDPSDPKLEDSLGTPLSPYAASKRIDEIYALTLLGTHGVDSVGLRYFNVFGPRQDPRGAYAAVIPRWISALFSGEQCVLFGDGSATRDFCFVENVVQANLLAACAPDAHVEPRLFNVACGNTTSLLELYASVRRNVARYLPTASDKTPRFEAPRPGDIPHSRACIDRARGYLGYQPVFEIERGIEETVRWFAGRFGRRPITRPGTSNASVDARMT